MQAQIDLMIDGSDAGRVRSHPAGVAAFWDRRSTVRPGGPGWADAGWRSSAPSSFDKTEGTDETLEAANDALRRAQHAKRPEVRGVSRARRSATTLLKTGDATEGIARLENAVRLADRLGTPTGTLAVSSGARSGPVRDGRRRRCRTAFREAATVIRE